MPRPAARHKMLLCGFAAFLLGSAARPAPAQTPDDSAPGVDTGALYGPYAMTREASGTSWQPQATPMDGLMRMHGEWMGMVHGFADLIYDDQGGPRGDTQSYSTVTLMAMGRRQLSAGAFGLRLMVSSDPTMGKEGYPLIFQTGETADGRTPLVDRQHPHDLLMEAAATYSQDLTS